MVNEKRLIDVNKLRGLKYEKVKFSDYKEGWNDAIDTICTETFLQSLDSVEVNYGRWKFRKTWDFFVCSGCNYESSNDYNYCPRCGLNMMWGN